MHRQGREQPDADDPLGIERFPNLPGLAQYCDPGRHPQQQPWQAQFDGYVGEQVMCVVKMLPIGEHIVVTAKAQAAPWVFRDHLQTGHHDLRAIGNTARQDQGFEKPERQHRDDQCERRDETTASVTAPDRHGQYREKQCQGRAATLAEQDKYPQNAQCKGIDYLHQARTRCPEYQPHGCQPDDVAAQDRMGQFAQPFHA
ncbi:hypothetical protein D3C72_1541870 [compost metagenome]